MALSGLQTTRNAVGGGGLVYSGFLDKGESVIVLVDEATSGGGMDDSDLPGMEPIPNLKAEPNLFKKQLESFLTKNEELNELRDEPKQSQEKTESLKAEKPKALKAKPVFISIPEIESDIINTKLDMLQLMDDRDKQSLLEMEEEDLVIFLLLM